MVNKDNHNFCGSYSGWSETRRVPNSRLNVAVELMAAYAAERDQQRGCTVSYRDGVTWMTLMLRPVSRASCSRMCRVGFGVVANAAFSVSSCFALMVVRGPRRFAPPPPPLSATFSLSPPPPPPLLLLLWEDTELQGDGRRSTGPPPPRSQRDVDDSSSVHAGAASGDQRRSAAACRSAAAVTPLRDD